MNKDSYVYIYYDPDTKIPFYVGKGTNNRDVAHLKPSYWKNPKNSVNPFLYFKIRKIVESNKKPIIKRIAENLDDSTAYELEHLLIKFFGRRFVDGGVLFNISTCKGGSPVGVKKTWNKESQEQYRKYWKLKRINIDRNELYELYINQNWLRIDVANYFGVSESLIKVRLKEFGIKKSKFLENQNKKRIAKNEELSNGFCFNCGCQLENKKRKYCSKICFGTSRRKPVKIKGVCYSDCFEAANVLKLSVSHIRCINEFRRKEKD